MKLLCPVVAASVLSLICSLAAQVQGQERTIRRVKWRNEPLELTKPEVGGREVKFDQAFQAQGDDWFRGLAITVRNTTSRPIRYISVGLTFGSSGAGDLPSRDWLLYGCLPPENEVGAKPCGRPPLQPNETATLVLQDYESTRVFLNETGKPQDIGEFEMSIGEVIFADGRMWSAGQIFERDPDDPNRWVPERKRW